MTAQTTVTIEAVYPDGTDLTNRRVVVQLIHGGAGGTVDGELIAERTTVPLSGAGPWSIALYPTAAISPSGCFYRFTIDNSSPTINRDISVPSSGPVSWTDAAILLENPEPPVTIPAAVSGTAGQVLGVVDPGDGPRYDLIDQTGGGTTDASELTTGTLPFARLPIGTTSTTVPAGNDTRLSDARTPTAHKTSHATGGGDALAPSDIGAVPMSRTLAGLDLSADRTASALRTALGLVIGTDVLAPNGSGASLTGIPESAVTNLVTDLAAKAPLASPTFTGTPAAPTAATGTNTTQVATSALVVASVGGGIFGDGSDGAVTISSNTSITRDMFYSSLTVNSGVTLTARGYRIFVNGTLTNNGTISADGNSASGTAQGDGAIGTLNSPGGGQLAQTGAGANAASVSASLGGSGGAGGAGSGGAGGTGGTATAPTAAQGSPRTYPFCTTLVLTHAAGSTALRGGGGGGSGGGDGGASGAGASGGHLLVVVARFLVNNGVLRSVGGVGGNAAGTNRGGGGGGGGGAIVLTYVTKSGSGSTSVLGGAGGTATGTGVAGSSGSAGNVYEVACV